MPTPVSTPGGIAVVKLGGSLMSDRAGLVRLVEQAVAAPSPVVLVPGGGVFADAVRAAQGQLGFSDQLAHRLALDAMTQFAEVLCELSPRLRLAVDARAIASAHRARRVPVWSPAALRSGHPAIPESWETTSDSLAAFLSADIAAASLILVKSADLTQVRADAPEPDDRPVARLVAAGIIDSAFPAFLARCSGIVRVLGSEDHPRLGTAIAEALSPVGLRLR